MKSYKKKIGKTKDLGNIMKIKNNIPRGKLINKITA